ncbi:MAG: radical SAM protein [Nitrospirae bacterium]|nr:radical SAM protein [Nitrospirota bacterium]
MKIDNFINTDTKNILLHRDQLNNYLTKQNKSLVTIEIDLTNSCNQRCPQCTFGDYHTGLFLNRTVLDRLIETIPEIGVKGMIITGGGEPCLHKDLGYFVKAVSHLGVDITLTTNGQFVERHFDDLLNGLKRIRVSIDAMTPASYKYTHGMEERDFHKVIENLRNLADEKKKRGASIDIGVSFMICEPNASEVMSAIEFYREIGVNFLHFKPMQLWDKVNKKYYHKFYPMVEQVTSELKSFTQGDFRVSISRENYYKQNLDRIKYNICHGAFFDMIIGADASVYTCCHFKYNPDFCYGNIASDGLNDILKKIKADVTKECFKDCKMDALNQLIEYGMLNPSELLDASVSIDRDKLPLGSKWL